MIVVISPSALSLQDADNFKAFSAKLDGAVTAAPGGVKIDGDHVWIPVSAVRALGPANDASWLSQFDGMIAYARSKGWIDPATDAVRAHIEA